MSLLSSREYWESRYKIDPEPFDWYQRLSLNEQLRDAMLGCLLPAGHTLVVGAGTSRMTEELWRMQSQRFASTNFSMTNIDFSSACITLLNERYARMGLTGIQNIIMDVRTMEFGAGTFDVVIDKATLDSILCGEGGVLSGAKLLSEISRVLKPGGVFILLSNEPPKQRLPILEKPQYLWRCMAQAVPKPGSERLVTHIDASFGSDESNSKNHFLYILTREAQTIESND